MLTEAKVVHHTRNRLRIRIDSCRGDYQFFDALKTGLEKDCQCNSVVTNPITGSVLIVGEKIGLSEVVEYGKDKKLFALSPPKTHPQITAASIARPISKASENIREFTGGQIDLPGALFLSLLVFGAYEVLRGNVKAPPWYTAFWYAFGLFTKSIIDQTKE